MSIVVPRDQALVQIQRLFNAANDKMVGSSEEREQIMTKTFEILGEHNLSMQGAPVEDKEDREDTEIKEEFPDPFRRVLANTIADLCFCRYFASKVPNKQKYKFTFVGLETNVVAAREMASYIIRSVSKQGSNLKLNGGTVADDTKFRNDEAIKITNRVANMMSQFNQAGTIANFDVTEDAANDKYINSILGVTLVTKKNLPEEKVA